MKTYLWSARYSTARGHYWKLERECVNTGKEWLVAFQKDKPEVLFKLSVRMPSNSGLLPLVHKINL